MMRGGGATAAAAVARVFENEFYFGCEEPQVEWLSRNFSHFTKQYARRLWKKQKRRYENDINQQINERRIFPKKTICF